MLGILGATFVGDLKIKNIQFFYKDGKYVQ